MKNEGRTKSPIKDLPVHVPGQSLDAQIQDELYDKVLAYILLASFMVVFAGLEWLRMFFNSKPAPKTYTAMAVLTIAYCAWRIKKGTPEIKKLILGRTGERAVGQYLEEHLRPIGCNVLHDIPGDGFNIDHVVIGPTGVYSIETKTHSKPAKGQANVQYDGKTVTVNGFKPDRDPLVQAKAGARSLAELIERSSGLKIFVRPVVLYAGWYIDKQPEGAEVWVLNEKALPAFISNAKKILPPEDVSLITFHLKRFVISVDQKQ
jgi:hypothetical protein